MMYDICFIAHNVLITVYFNTIIDYNYLLD